MRLRPSEAMRLEKQYGTLDAAIAAHPEHAAELERYRAMAKAIIESVSRYCNFDLEGLEERVIASGTDAELEQLRPHRRWLRAQGSSLPRLVEGERARRREAVARFRQHRQGRGPVALAPGRAGRQTPRSPRRPRTGSTARSRSPGRLDDDPHEPDLAVIPASAFRAEVVVLLGERR